MPRSLSRRELIRKFRALGFSGPHSGKRHQFMKKGDLKVRIPNPHQSRTIDLSLLMRILCQAGISDAQWDIA